MKSLIGIVALLAVAGVSAAPTPQQNTAKTDLPGKGPCTNFPIRYQKLAERLAWFYGCMHENPPTIAEVRARIAKLPERSQAALRGKDEATQEALIGVAHYDLPVEIFPK